MRKKMVIASIYPKPGSLPGNLTSNRSVWVQAWEHLKLDPARDYHGGHMTDVAAQLGISRNILYRKIKRHSIQITRRPHDS